MADFLSKSSSTDILESLGININLKLEQISNSINETGMGFIFASNYHPVMKNISTRCRELRHTDYL